MSSSFDEAASLALVIVVFILFCLAARYGYYKYKKSNRKTVILPV